MEDSLAEARLGVIDTIRGVLLELADIESVEGDNRVQLVEQMGDVADMILEVLEFDVVGFDETSNEITAKLRLQPIQ